MKEFTPSQVKKYLEKVIGSKWEIAHEKIKSIYNFKDLSSRPVWLDMIVKILPKIDPRSIQKFNIADLYEVFTSSWFERKGHWIQVTKKDKIELIEDLAYKFFQEEQKSIHYTSLLDVLNGHLKSKLRTANELEVYNYTR